MLRPSSQPVNHPFVANKAAIEYVFPEPIDIGLPPEQQVDRILAEGRCAAWNEHLLRTFAIHSAVGLQGSNPREFFANVENGDVDDSLDRMRQNLYDFVKNHYFRDGVTSTCDVAGQSRCLDTSYYGYIENGALERLMMVFKDDAAVAVPSVAAQFSEQDTIGCLSELLHIEREDDYLSAAVALLCALTGADAAMIATTHVSGESVVVGADHVFYRGMIRRGMTWPLKETPCAEVLHKGAVVYPQQVQQLFPQADYLRQLDAQAYIGVALYAEYHRPVGVIALLHSSGFDNVETARALLRIVAPRTLLVLNSRREQEKQTTFERQRDFIEHNASGMYVIDIQPPLPIDLPIHKQVKWIAEHGVCIDCNEALIALFGADSKHQVVGPNAIDINEVYDFGGMARHFISRNYQLQDEVIKSIDLKGRSRWISTTATGYVEGKYLRQILGVLTDVTERVRYTRTIEYQANHDELTGLANRKYFIERLGERIHGAGDDTKFALLILDLDGFKEVNDTLGHDTGDALLRMISERLALTLAPLAADLARLGGDEFAVLVHDYGHQNDVIEIATELVGAMKQPYLVNELELVITGSLGVALFPYHGSTASALMRCADVAMYQAKRHATDYQVYSPEHDHHTLRRLGLMMDIRQAISNRELVLYYQPIVDIGSLDVLGFEALIRWQHPRHGLLLPGEFVPLIELTDMVLPMTWWVIESAIAQLACWQAMGLDYYVAVNISARNLADTGFPDRIRQLLQDYRVDGRHLECEITESSLMSEPEKARRVLNAMASLGVKISIDDYGTGYSSLAYLKSLPIDSLKIDRSFISQMLEASQDRIIVNSTIQLAHNLGLQVTAEGIESHDLVHVLATLNCDRGQGFYFCRPSPIESLEKWLAARPQGKRR